MDQPDPEFLEAMLAEAGMDQYSELAPDLALLARELLRWNQTHNLTGFRELRGLVVGMFLDSLVLVPKVWGRTVLDIGSGAGFPGLVLALARPELEVTLLEPRGKRVSFQKQVVRLLELQDRVIPVQGRAGEGALSGRRFSTVTARALGSLEQTLALARGYLAPGGRALLPRGLKDLSEALRLGLKVTEYELPPPGAKRLLVMQEP